MTDSVVDAKAEVKQATKYVKETENVAEKYSALTVSKNSSDVNMNVGEMPSAAFTAVPTLKSVKKVRASTHARARSLTHQPAPGRTQAGTREERTFTLVRSILLQGRTTEGSGGAFREHGVFIWGFKD